MKHPALSILVILLTIITSFSCSKHTVKEEIEVNKDTVQGNFFKISQEYISVAKEENSIAIDIITDYKYSVVNNSDWISMMLEKDSVTNGICYLKYRLLIRRNESGDRSDTILFKTSSEKRYLLRVSQKGRSPERIKDSLALVALYNSTNGNGWTNNSNWLSEKPLYAWYGINCTSTGIIQGTARVEGITLYNNNLEGVIPKEIANMDSLISFNINENKLTGEIPEEVFNHPNWWCWEPSYRVAWQKKGYGFSNFDRPVEHNVSEHGKVTLLYKSTKGKGVNLIITADGFPSSSMASGGEFEAIAKGIMNNVFGIEPFKTYKEYFNVYMIKAVSKNRYISDPHYNRETFYEIKLKSPQNIDYFDSFTINHKISSLLGFDISNSTVLMVLNHDASMGCGGTNYFDVGYAFFTYSESYYIGNKGYKINDFPVHEIGHAFAGLADEYSYSYPPSTEFIKYWNDNYDTLEKNLNKSILSDPAKVPWAHLIGLPGYEMVGIFAGADFPQFYRSEEKSLMRGDAQWFNAISREIIVKRIMELSGMTYSFDNFLKLDKR